MFGETYALTLWYSSSDRLTFDALYEGQLEFAKRFAQYPNRLRLDSASMRSLLDDAHQATNMRVGFNGQEIMGMRIEVDRDIQGWRVELVGVKEEVLPDSGRAPSVRRQIEMDPDAMYDPNASVSVRNIELVTGAKREPMAAQPKGDNSPIDRERFRNMVFGSRESDD